MSETFNQKEKPVIPDAEASTPQAPESYERSEVPQVPQERLRQTKEAAESSQQNNPAELLNEARQELKETPADGSAKTLETINANAASGQPVQPLNIRQELKDITVKRELFSIQRQHSAPKRAFSRLIHQPAIRAVSEGAGKTVSRPSGLLGGSLVAFLGTTGYFVVAKHYGYSYNYLLFLALFIGGFIIGLILELLVHIATASRRQSRD